MPRSKTTPYVPAHPLGEAVLHLAAKSDLKTVCKRAGIQERIVTRWRRYEQGDLVDLDLADRVLTGLGLLWWDVWTPETVREPVFVVTTYHHHPKRVPSGEYVVRRIKDRTIPYGDLGTDFWRLRQIESVMSGQSLAVAA